MYFYTWGRPKYLSHMFPQDAQRTSVHSYWPAADWHEAASLVHCTSVQPATKDIHKPTLDGDLQ